MMIDYTMPLLDALLKRGGGDFMKNLVEEVLARPIAFDVEGQIGAARFRRSQARTTQRNGFRPRAFDMRLGTLELKIPKLRQGSYFPAFLEPRRTTEQALVAVIQEAWIKGVDPQGGRPRTGYGDRGLFRRARCRSCAPASTAG